MISATKIKWSRAEAKDGSHGRPACPAMPGERGLQDRREHTLPPLNANRGLPTSHRRRRGITLASIFRLCTFVYTQARQVLSVPSPKLVTSP